MSADIAYYFDDFEIGAVFESGGRTITQADIVAFAGFSGDFNPIHIDHEFAKSTPFRQVIAHGLGIFCIGGGLSTVSPPSRTVAMLGVHEWKFLAPVFIGDTIRMRSTVLEKTLKGIGKRGEIVWLRQIVNQEGKIVQEGKMTTMIEARTRSAS